MLVSCTASALLSNQYSKHRTNFCWLEEHLHGLL